MTTTITVDAHAGWPVSVITVDQKFGMLEDGSLGPTGETFRTEDTVEPNTVRSFYVTNSRSLTISELPRPPGT